MSEHQADPKVIECPESLDISVAATFCETLRSTLDSNDAVVLDGESIERVDTACLQLLCSLFMSEQLCDGQVYWQRPSAALTDAARLLGLTEHLRLV